jgi:DNA-binding NarL/FixJ family response regulator
MKCGRVLVADPYARMFEGIRVLLEEIFETIAIVVDGDSFLEVIKELQPELVIMDLSLKDRGGINPFLRFRSLFANIKCIILSVDDDQIFARWAPKTAPTALF